MKFVVSVVGVSEARIVPGSAVTSFPAALKVRVQSSSAETLAEIDTAPRFEIFADRSIVRGTPLPTLFPPPAVLVGVAVAVAGGVGAVPGTGVTVGVPGPGVGVAVPDGSVVGVLVGVGVEPNDDPPIQRE